MKTHTLIKKYAIRDKLSCEVEHLILSHPMFEAAFRGKKLIEEEIKKIKSGKVADK